MATKKLKLTYAMYQKQYLNNNHILKHLQFNYHVINHQN